MEVMGAECRRGKLGKEESFCSEFVASCTAVLFSLDVLVELGYVLRFPNLDTVVIFECILCEKLEKLLKLLCQIINI
jgi:hypothetical protein